MRYLLLVFVCIFGLMVPALAQEEYQTLETLDSFDERFYKNPSSLSGIGDPFILQEGDTWYCYATGGEAAKGFYVWKTDDLNQWSMSGKTLCFAGTDWGTTNYWAPEVHRYADQYVLVYSAQYGEDYDLRLGIAFADNPEGPFTDPLGKPWLDTEYCAIDAHLFVDDDGTPYLFYIRDNYDNPIGDHLVSQTYGVQLSADLLSTVGESVLLTTPENDWELKSGYYIWNEGVYVLKHDGRYYLYFSANFTSTHDYCVGVAVADSPLGEYEKPEANPLLTAATMSVFGGETYIASGPGHNAFFTVGDELFTSYHVNTSNDNPSMNRTLCIDRAGFHEDGSAFINGVTVMTKQLLPLSQLGLVNAAKTALLASDGQDELLRDGDYCIAEVSAAYLWHGTQCEFTWETPVLCDMILIYPSRGSAGTGRIILNDQLCAEIALSAVLPGAACMVGFSPMNVTSCRILWDQETEIGEVLILAGDQTN